jgi:hypothetical protein
MRRHTLLLAPLGLSLLLASCSDSPPPVGTPDHGRPDFWPRSDSAPFDTTGPGGDQRRADARPPDQLKTASSTQPVTFAHQEKPFDGFGVDTGWQPASSPVQIRFTTSAASDAEATLPGKATLQRATQLTLSYAGDASAGKLKMDIGFQVGGELKIDAVGVKWQGKLPFVPQFDFRFTDEKSFTPFVLPGATPRPIHAEATKAKQQLFYVPIPGLSICLWGSIGCAGGVVVVKAGGTLAADFSGLELDTALTGGSTLKLTADKQTVTTPDLGKNPQPASATYKASVKFSGTITLYPTITITTPIPGLQWDVAEFPIPIDLSTFGPLDYTWDFAAQSLSFDLK